MVYVRNPSAKGNKSHCYVFTMCNAQTSENQEMKLYLEENSQMKKQKQVGANDQAIEANTPIFTRGEKY